jgi:hypothetical protein
MKLRKKPVYPIKTTDTYDVELLSPTSIHGARDVAIKYLVDNGDYTYDELRHSLSSDQIFIDHHSGYHMDEDWDLFLRIEDLTESNATFGVRVDKYWIDHTAYDKWYDANISKILLEERRLEEEKESRAILKSIKIKNNAEKKRLADITKLEKQLAALKGEAS